MIKSTFRLINLFTNKIRDDHVEAYSAQAAFFIMISFIPFLMLLLSIVKFFPLERNDMLKLLTDIFPESVDAMIVSIINQIYDTATSSTVISITAISALWSAGQGFLAIMKGLNTVYDIKETRNDILLRLIATFYTLIFAVMLLATMVLFVFGNQFYFWIEQKLPKLMDTALLIISLRTILGLVVMIIFFLLIYIVIPNRKAKIINELPGAIFCAAGWMTFSYAFSYYIDNFSNFTATYGSLTAIVLFMLWLYFCMYFLFLGAEINLMFENRSFVKKLKQLYKKSPKDPTIHR